MSRHICQPLGVGHVGLTAGHVLDMEGVDQPHLLEQALDPIEHRVPIRPSGFRYTEYVEIFKMRDWLRDWFGVTPLELEGRM